MKFETAQGIIQSFAAKYPSAESIPDKEVPASFDPRNVEGYDFTGKVRDQSKCGSCYQMSMAQVIESRLKFRTGQDVPMLSTQ